MTSEDRWVAVWYVCGIVLVVLVLALSVFGQPIGAERIVLYDVSGAELIVVIPDANYRPDVQEIRAIRAVLFPEHLRNDVAVCSHLGCVDLDWLRQASAR